MKLAIKVIAALGATTLVACAAGDASAAPALKVIHDFCSEANCADGGEPFTTMLLDKETGTLFGTTQHGGEHGLGGVFSLTPNARGTEWTYRMLTNFNTLGVSEGDLIMDTQGALYGTTALGGEHNGGVVFRLTPDGQRTNWTFSILYEFCAQTDCTDGSAPWSGLAYMGAQTGALYDGVSPLYGTTGLGGKSRHGVVYELARNGDVWTHTVIHGFCRNCDAGRDPRGTLIPDADGNLFGTTNGGGPNDGGAAFELSPRPPDVGWKLTLLHSFCSQPSCADGATPPGGMIWDGSGHLLGTASGDTAPSGVVFRLTPRGPHTREKILHSFCLGDCKDGFNPLAGLARDAKGNLFGTTAQGGDTGQGTVFKLTPKGELRILHNFCSEADCTDGGSSWAGVTLGNHGEVYGVSASGGAFQKGVIFQINQ